MTAINASNSLTNDACVKTQIAIESSSSNPHLTRVPYDAHHVWTRDVRRHGLVEANRRQRHISRRKDQATTRKPMEATHG